MLCLLCWFDLLSSVKLRAIFLCGFLVSIALIRMIGCRDSPRKDLYALSGIWSVKILFTCRVETLLQPGCCRLRRVAVEQRTVELVAVQVAVQPTFVIGTQCSKRGGGWVADAGD